jgi:ABC-2 type transport system permease protein
VIARYRALAAGFQAEWRHLCRHPSVFVVLLGVPLIYPLLISALYVGNQATERPALLVDDDGSAASRRLALALDATQEVRIAGRPSTREEAFDALRRGEVELVLWIPPDFSRHLARGETATVTAWADAANVYTYGLAYPGLAAAASSLGGDLAVEHFREKGLPAAAAAARAAPVVRDEHALFHPTASYGPFLVPGILLVVLQQLVLLSLGYSAGMQRDTGTWSLDPRFPFSGLEGRLLAHAGFHLGGAAAIAFAVFPAFGWPATSGPAVLALFAAFLVAMSPIAVLVANACPDRHAAFQLLMFASVPALMMSGFAWPRGAMPGYLAAVAAAIPTTHALSALRVLSMKSPSLAAVLPQLGAMAATFAGWLVVAVAFLHRPWRRAPTAGERPGPREPIAAG